MQAALDVLAGLQVCAEELVLERLARSIRREQSMHTLLRGVLFGFTLTPRQFFTVRFVRVAFLAGQDAYR